MAYGLAKERVHNSRFVKDRQGAGKGDVLLDLVIGLVVGLFAVAYVLPAGMTALGSANTTGWPTGTSAFIVPIGIFVMIALLVAFAKR